MQPGDGLEWKTEKGADGHDIQTEILQVRIDSTVSSSTGQEGRIPVDLSVSQEGLKGEVDLTIDDTEHDLWVENQAVQGHQGSIVSCGHSWRRRGRIELSRAPAEKWEVCCA